MSLADLSPRLDPRIAWATVLALPAFVVVPIIGSATMDGVYLSRAQLLIALAWCGALAAAGLYWFYYGFSRKRGLADTPTSRIASAAQGYVELWGDAFKLDGVNELFAKNGVPCLWLRRVGGTEPDAGTDGTQQPFGVRDESGYAVVLPYGAHVEAVRRETWSDEDGNAYSEDRIYAGDKLYILGEFTSSEPSFDLEKAVANKLLQWREDPRALLSRFDADRNGQIDSGEDWKMRIEALEVARTEEATALSNYRAVNLIKSPADGRAFVISTRPRRSFGRRLLIWQFAGLAAFVAGSIGTASLGLRLLARLYV